MRHRFLIALLAAAASPAAAQPSRTDDTAAERTTEPRAISEAEDPVNRLVARTTVEGLLVRLRIDGAAVTLEEAQPAMIPRPAERRNLPGDTVTVTALSADAAVASVTVPDQRINVQEGVGIVVQQQRSLVIAVPAPGVVDAIDVRLSATGESRRFDVNAAYARPCRSFPEAPFCRGRRQQPR